jgi:hypothetical protein
LDLLGIIAVRPAVRERFVDFVYNGKHLFAYEIDGQPAEGADGLTVRHQPSSLFADFLAAVRAGEGKLDDHGVVRYEAPSGKSASVDLIESSSLADFPRSRIISRAAQLHAGTAPSPSKSGERCTLIATLDQLCELLHTRNSNFLLRSNMTAESLIMIKPSMVHELA